MRRDTPLHLYAPIHVLDYPLHSFSCARTEWMTYFSKNNIRISCSLKYKRSKKGYIIYKKKKIKKTVVQCQLCFEHWLILQRKTPA